MRVPFSGQTKEKELERLRRLLAESESRLAEAAELAAHVRHEINNPLTGLMGQAQLLLREDLSETARRRVRTIEQLAERIRDTAAELRRLQPPDDAPDATNQHDAADAESERDEPPRH